MSTETDKIKRKLLVKYPTFGSIIANLDFQQSNSIDTAGTDGKVLLYNPDFLNNLNENQQIFLFAHEVCHIAFDHIFRSEGRDKDTWNTAADAVTNALLVQDGLTMIDGGVNIPEAINYDVEEMYNKLLKERRKLDIIKGYTTKGIHRDDFKIFINDKDLSIYGSQGQHRTSILSLRMAELDIIYDEIGEYPILLLDDFMSELDEKRRKHLLEKIENIQVIITCTDKIKLENKNILIYNVKDGKVIKENQEV